MFTGTGYETVLLIRLVDKVDTICYVPGFSLVLCQN